jgi:hypothetical protein
MTIYASKIYETDDSNISSIRHALDFLSSNPFMFGTSFRSCGNLGDEYILEDNRHKAENT